MITELRVFNEAGAAAYSHLFEAHERSEIPDLAHEISGDPGLTEVLETGLEIPIPKTRLELAQTIAPYIGLGADNESASNSPAFWNWLSARLMCEVLDSNSKVGEKKRWLYSRGARTEYRHILASAYLTYSTHKEDLESVMGFLCQDLATFGELLEQVLATRALAGSVGMQLASAIYYDPVTGENKLGHGSKGAGSARRLVAFLNQIRLTVDIKSMSVNQLRYLLPPEFDKFNSAGASFTS